MKLKTLTTLMQLATESNVLGGEDARVRINPERIIYTFKVFLPSVTQFNRALNQAGLPSFDSDVDYVKNGNYYTFTVEEA